MCDVDVDVGRRMVFGLKRGESKRRNKEGRERRFRGKKHNKFFFFLQYCEQCNSMFRIVL